MDGGLNGLYMRPNKKKNIYSDKNRRRSIYESVKWIGEQAPEVLRRSSKTMQNKSPIKMTAYGRPTKLPEGVPPQHENLETEERRQLKELLIKQLDPNLNMKEHFSRHRAFEPSHSLEPISKELAGQLSSSDFKIRESRFLLNDIKFEEHGMHCNEIESRFETIINDDTTRERKRRKLGKRIYPPVKSHEYVDRLAAGINLEGSNKRRLLLQNSAYAIYHPDDPINHLKDMEHELLVRVTSTGFQRCKYHEPPVERDVPCRNKERFKHVDDNESVAILGLLMLSSEVLPKQDRVAGSKVLPKQDPVVRTYVAPISDEEIMNNKLTAHEIQQIPRFKDYDEGMPSRVLFLKNLSDDVTETDLISVFSRFEKNPDELLKYRLMKGKMRGQAFITFANMTSAAIALCLTNGFLLKGKPMIIQFGRQAVEDD